jgi:nucleoside-diphosphate-sugar epimerase
MNKQPGKLNVLITGANGLIGNLVYARLADQPEAYDVFAMVRTLRPSARAAGIEFHEIPVERQRLADLQDFAAVRRAVEGMDVAVHLAAEPNGNAGWESVLNNNILGAHNIFEACRLAGVRRVIYGSTNQVVFGYQADEAYRTALTGAADPLRRIDHTQPTRPLNFYACSKVFGEALAHMYATTHGLSCLCLRIGWVVDDDRVPGPRAQGLWCSQRDIVQLIERCILAPESLRFDVFFGHSDNHNNLVDIQHARDVLGYEPQDRAEDQLA